MATVGRRVSESARRGGGVGLAGAALALVLAVGAVVGVLLTRGAEAEDAAPAAAAASAGAVPQTDVKPAAEQGLLKPTLQCPGKKVKTVEVKAKGSSSDSPTVIARRWLDGKGEGQPKGVRPSTFRVIVPGGAGSATAKQGYLMLLDRDQIMVALVEIGRPKSGDGWVSKQAFTCG